MRNILILLTLFSFSWGAKILSYNIYDRSDRVDIMLTFDTPYEGIIRQNQQLNTFIIKLEDASIEESKSKTIESKYLNKIDILSQENSVEIVARANNQISMVASKTADSYGLRLRFMSQAQPLPTKDALSEKRLPTKSDSEFSSSYYVVIAILLIGIGILFYLKQSIAKKTSQGEKLNTPWLFEQKQNIKPPAESINSATMTNSPIEIRFQKKLDDNHSVVMLDYANMSYLMVLGSHPVLLDKFQDSVALTQNDFETLLYNKRNELNNYFELGHTEIDSFDSYKEKASREY